MTTDTILLEKREELKRRLAAGEYKTLVDIFLESFDRLIRKITRRSKPLPTWYITIILILILSLTSFVIPYIELDLKVTREVLESLGLGLGIGILFGNWIIVVTILFSVMLNRYIGRIFFFWQNEMLDLTETAASVQTFENWLNKICNKRLHLLAATGGALFATSSTIIPLRNQLGIFIGYAFIFVSFIVNLFVFSFVFQVFLVGLLSSRLRQYDLKLFAADPASSQIISRLSSELSYVVYLVAVLASMITLTIALPGLLPSYGILLLLSYWLALISIFSLNHIGLSSMIRRAKWKTLNEIQVKVDALQHAEDFENKETMETINRLMDYHDRVLRTRNSAIDLNSTLNFINSLLLPLLAFVLGNLNLVLSLFKRQP